MDANLACGGRKDAKRVSLVLHPEFIFEARGLAALANYFENSVAVGCRPKNGKGLRQQLGRS